MNQEQFEAARAIALINDHRLGLHLHDDNCLLCTMPPPPRERK